MRWDGRWWGDMPPTAPAVAEETDCCGATLIEMSGVYAPFGRGNDSIGLKADGATMAGAWAEDDALLEEVTPVPAPESGCWCWWCCWWNGDDGCDILLDSGTNGAELSATYDVKLDTVIEFVRSALAAFLSDSTSLLALEDECWLLVVAWALPARLSWRDDCAVLVLPLRSTEVWREPIPGGSVLLCLLMTIVSRGVCPADSTKPGVLLLRGMEAGKQWNYILETVVGSGNKRYYSKSC